jgi:hypothetical protein
MALGKLVGACMALSLEIIETERLFTIRENENLILEFEK